MSGLSGSVVLRDNGGDDLSVSANGPFTFATKLVDGAAYAVTVKTNPSGQTCSVSNGSGTVAGANVTGVAVACAGVSGSASDNFNRADGGLGSSWSAVSDGALSISSQAVLGSSATAGDIRIGETYAGDQSSQIEVTSTQLSGGQWIGPAVRMQAGGQNMYLGIYFWNNGSQQLRVYKRSAGNWIQLGSSYNCWSVGGGHTAEAVGGGLDDLVPAERRGPDHRHGRQRHGRRAGDHDLRDGQGRQLGRHGRQLIASGRRIRLAGACRGCRGRSCCRTTAATI